MVLHRPPDIPLLHISMHTVVMHLLQPAAACHSSPQVMCPLCPDLKAPYIHELHSGKCNRGTFFHLTGIIDGRTVDYVTPSMPRTDLLEQHQTASLLQEMGGAFNSLTPPKELMLPADRTKVCFWAFSLVAVWRVL